MSKIISNENPLLNVYLMKIPENMDILSVFPPQRDIQIQCTATHKKRLERYAVWKLLENAIGHSFDTRIEDLVFSEKNGKWSCDTLSFSLSHSHGAAAVAVSNRPCGIDIENLDRFIQRHKDPTSVHKVMRRICSENELSASSSAREVLSVWTKKECIFKCYGSGQFFSRKVDLQAHQSKTIPVSLGEEYILSVCGDGLNNLQCFILDDSRFHEITF